AAVLLGVVQDALAGAANHVRIALVPAHAAAHRIVHGVAAAVAALLQVRAAGDLAHARGADHAGDADRAAAAAVVAVDVLVDADVGAVGQPARTAARAVYARQ